MQTIVKAQLGTENCSVVVSETNYSIPVSLKLSSSPCQKQLLGGRTVVLNRGLPVHARISLYRAFISVLHPLKPGVCLSCPKNDTHENVRVGSSCVDASPRNVERQWKETSTTYLKDDALNSLLRWIHCKWEHTTVYRQAGHWNAWIWRMITLCLCHVVSFCTHLSNCSNAGASVSVMKRAQMKAHGWMSPDGQ